MKLCQSCQIKYPSQTVHCTTGHCGALLIPIPELDPGTRIGKRFRILETLGTGGFGTVYLAEQILNPSAPMRALKFPNSDVIRDAHSFTRFQQEAALNLIHPNIVYVYDLDQADDGSYYFPMEYVPGCELRDLIATGPFRVERALALARGIAAGLQAAHARNIVHRDIKPENIRVANPDTPNETPKLLDFGIAAFKESNSGVSTNRGPGFSPPYAAPEQWRGQRGQQLDGRTDLYALGGVLYEMLTGRNPFNIDSLADYSEWSYQHLQGQRIAASSFRPELLQWAGLDELLLHTLAVDREDRPSDVAEFLRYLDDVQQRRPPHKPWRPIASPRLTVRTGPNVRVETVVIPTGPGQTYPGFQVPGSSLPGNTNPRLVQTGPHESAPTFSGLDGVSVAPKPDRKPALLTASIILAVAIAGGLGYFAFERSESPTPSANSTQDAAFQTGQPGAAQNPPSPKPLGNEHQRDQQAVLIVSCDLACNLRLDHGGQVFLGPGTSRRFSVQPGNHTVEAAPTDPELTSQQKSLPVSGAGNYDAAFRFLPEKNLKDQQSRDIAANAQRYTDAMQRAQQKYNGKDDCGAIAAYNEALHYRPGDQAAKTGLGTAQTEQSILGPCDAK